MSALATPLVGDTSAWLVRLNPVAKLAAAFAITLGLLLAGDVVTPALVLAVELGAVVVSGIRWRRLLARSWPLLVGVCGLAVSTLLFTEERGGAVLFVVGSLEVTTESMLAASAVSVRVLAIALPGIITFATTDPTELADALVQHLRTPPRFTFGALAAFRLMPLLGDEWRTLLLARRARGIDAGWSPIRRVRLFGSAVFGLLVAAIRKAVRLAAAMEARGFGKVPDRSLARPSPIRLADKALVVGAVCVVGLAHGFSLALGSWRFLFW